MSRGIVLGPRRVGPEFHNGPSSHPLTGRLINAAWGTPLLDINGHPPITAPSTRPSSDGRGGSVGNGSFNTTPQHWRARFLLANNDPVSIFGLIKLDSTSERGIVVGIGNVANGDTGVNIGVGNTAPDSAANNLVGVRGGINYNASGVAIGTGVHSIGYTVDGSATQWFIDGLLVSTGGTGSTYNVSGAATFLMMQHSGNTTIGPSAGIHVYFGAAWATVLPSSAFAELHEDPWVVARC